MRYKKTEQELYEGRIKELRKKDDLLRRLYERVFFEDCTYLLSKMNGLKEETEENEDLDLWF